MDFYSTLKAVSMVATGIFGVIGILTNYKDKDGKVTRWGKVAITGVLFSATLSLLLYSLETGKAKMAAEETAKKNKETQAKLDSALQASDRQSSLLRTSLDRSQALEAGLKATAGSLKEINSSSREMALKQASLLRAQLWQVRELFPIAPLNVWYTVTITFDRQEFFEYMKRISDTVGGRARHQEGGPRGRRISLKDCLDGRLKCPDVLTDNMMLLEDGRVVERPPASTKVRDEFFDLSGPNMPDPFIDGQGVWGLLRSYLHFNFSGEAVGLIMIRTFGTPERPEDSAKCPLYLSVNFFRHQFRQTVFCDNLRLRGSNSYASSFDLIGKTMTWREEGELDYDGSEKNFHERAYYHLETVGFKFPNQSADPFMIDVSGISGNTGVRLTANMLNLTDVLKTAKQPEVLSHP